MIKRKYMAPVLFTLDDGGEGTVVGDGTGQGSIPPEMTYEEWWDEIAWGGNNPDADYNGDGVVDVNDYNYYIENELWNG